MKISVNWLRNYVNIPHDTDWQAFSNLLTTRTAEVEEIIDQSSSFQNMVIGQIKSILPHPNADKLRITITDVGDTTQQIVCGASNIYEGQKVAVALPGAKVKWHGEGDLITLQPAKIRGTESFGMICAGSEIGLIDSKNPDGIIDLSHLKDKAGTPLAIALNKNDVIIDIENKTLTHRPDLWGHYGIAREIAAITDEKLKPIKTFTGYPKSLHKNISVDVQAPKLCPRYLTVDLNNITIAPSPDWLRQALESVGQKSINNIVDATNFVMLELGNPLHAFDTDKIQGKKLIIKQINTEEKVVTLDQEEKSLPTGTLVIADQKEILAIAGIKGCANSGITADTTQITLEAANFNPIQIRQTSTKLGLRSEAVQRFEKDLDPLLAEQALDRLVEIILNICPSAQISSAKQDINNFHYQERHIKLNLEQANNKIGSNISDAEAKKLLEKLGFTVSLNKKTLTVTVPSFRATKDINHQDDLIEELARMYGYENIPATLPELTTRPTPRPNTSRREKHLIRDVFSLELGFHEVVNYSFYSLKTLQQCGLNEEIHLKIKNYLSEEQTHLRVSLLPYLFSNIKENLKTSTSFRLFESGRTYKLQDQFFPLEENHFAGVIVAENKNTQPTFYQTKTCIETLIRRLGINSLEYSKSLHLSALAHPNKHAIWKTASGQEIIEIFDLHPQIAQNLGLEKQQISCFTINHTKLHQEVPRSSQKFHPINKFPPLAFDISMIANLNMEVGTIQKIISTHSPESVSNIQLFDLYQGPNLPSDKKSLTFQITLQSAEKTLTKEDLQQALEQISKGLKKEGMEIR